MNETKAQILIVDDQLSTRDVLKGLLTNQSYNLAFAANGEDALAKAAELLPDLILLDVMMPEMDGFEVCRRLRANPLLMDAPVIMVTALDDLKSRLQGIEAGADDFITKPFNTVELLARVKAITRLNYHRRLHTMELQAERDRTQAILEALGDAVIVTKVDGTIEYLNPAATRLTGFSGEEAHGQSWHLWHSRRTRQQEGHSADRQLYDEIAKTVGNGQSWRNEVINKRKDGSLYEAMLTVAPLFAPNTPHQPIGFVSVQSDITMLKMAERLQAMHQEREKHAAIDRLRHTFLSTINHEMRTPLMLIFQLIEALEESPMGLAEEQLDALMALQRQVSTLHQMVQGLTRVAAFLSKQETVRPVLAHLEPIFNNVIPVAEFKARSKEITIKSDIASKMPFFPLDVKQMEEALTQLVDNAIKFNEAGGQVNISAQADENWVKIAVSDTGIGIEPEQMNRIWEVFEQGVDPLQRAQEGLGLGLVLSRYIIEAHRGVIEVESTPGQGSTFTIKLPKVETITG